MENDIQPTSVEIGSEKRKSRPGLTTAIVALLICLVLAWAVATIFEIVFIKALAAAVLILFVVVVGLLMMGVA